MQYRRKHICDLKVEGGNLWEEKGSKRREMEIKRGMGGEEMACFLSYVQSSCNNIYTTDGGEEAERSRQELFRDEKKTSKKKQSNRVLG